jgi:hypothetical protein
MAGKGTATTHPKAERKGETNSPGPQTHSPTRRCSGKNFEISILMPLPKGNNDNWLPFWKPMEERRRHCAFKNKNVKQRRVK